MPRSIRASVSSTSLRHRLRHQMAFAEAFLAVVANRAPRSPLPSGPEQAAYSGERPIDRAERLPLQYQHRALNMHNWILVVTIFPPNDKDFFVQGRAFRDRIFETYNLKLSGDRLFSRRRH